MNSTSNKFEPSDTVKSLAVAASTAFSAAIAESGKTLDSICAATRDRMRCIEHEPKAVSAWCEPAITVKDENPLLRAAVILATTGDPVPLQWLCGQVGGVFVPDKSNYGGLPLLQSLPSDISQYPEMAEWLGQCERMAALKGCIYKLTMSGEKFADDVFADIIISWLSVKGWMEGYIEWTGSRGTNLLIPGRPCAESSSVEARHVLKYTFSKSPKGSPFTSKVATELDLSNSSVQKWQQRPNPGNSGSANPFDHLAVLSHATGSLKMIHWLCSQMKGNLRSARTYKTDNISPWPRVFWELTELEYFVSRALLDGDVKADEANNIREEWDDVRAWMASLLRSRVKQKS
jgi:hypothetical protein